MPSMVYLAKLHKIPGSKQGKSFTLQVVDHGFSDSNTSREIPFLVDSLSQLLARTILGVSLLGELARQVYIQEVFIEAHSQLCPKN